MLLKTLSLATAMTFAALTVLAQTPDQTPPGNALP